MFKKGGKTTQKADLSRIEGLIFDLDGTLIHSTIDFPQMRKRTFARMHEAGVPEGVLDRTKTIASNLAASFRYLETAGSVGESQSLCADAGRIMSEVEMQKVSETRPVDGAGRTVGRLVDEGYSVAILTRGSRRYTEAALSASGLSEVLTISVCRDDHPDEEAKPNPISMERAAGKLGLAKERCILVGDHAMDLECALSAGSVFIGVLSGANDQDAWTRLGEIIVIPDVSHLPELLSRC